MKALAKTLRTSGGGLVSISRDGHGIPTISAQNFDDGWWGLGYAAAEDRLWQMEYDRRRATGRWAEVVGSRGIAADVLARRLRLHEAAQRDVEVMDQTTLRTFECYADGVNAAAMLADSLPPEYAAVGIDFEPWLVWHSIAAFKVRHVLMGAWQHKLARALLYAEEGYEAFEEFDPVILEKMRLTTPAGSRQRAARPEDAAILALARDEVMAAAAELGFLSELESGSNAWVVAGTHTRSGAPLLANDAHRAVDVPNTYWQAHFKVADLNVSGATFPGIPGFPHFGHNGKVGWAITNAAADAQDLFTETFRQGKDGLEVQTSAGWSIAQVNDEIINVRGGESAVVRCVRTPNGPVVHGEPEKGRALSLRWTATEVACEQFGVLLKMLETTNVGAFLEAQREWVDPVNNLLCADTQGNIGYLLRGSLPRRRRSAAMEVPVPGWQEESQWAGRVAFEQMPREINPAIGYIANANNSVTDAFGEVKVSHNVSDFYRIERIYELLEDQTKHEVASMQKMQSDTVSIAARLWSEHLGTRGPFEGEAEQARQSLLNWDGDLSSERSAGLVYACFRRALAHQHLTERMSARGQQLLSGTQIPAGGVLLKRWLARLIWPTNDGAVPAAFLDEASLRQSLVNAWQDAMAVAGPEPTTWRWRNHHRLEPRHTLAEIELDTNLLSPDPVSVGGDSETIQAAAYGWPRGSSFAVTNTAVYRQILDFAALQESTWVIPGGASGRPDNVHFQDQLLLWGAGNLLSMEEQHGVGG